MKNQTNDVRQLDSLGRIVLPKKMRAALGINVNDNLRITLEGDAIVIRRDMPLCILCHKDHDLVEINGAYICSDCAEKITSQF